MAYPGRMTNLQTTAFGDWDVAYPNPKTQQEFIYGVNAYNMSTIITGSGTVSASSSLASVQSGAAINSSAVLRSRENLPYRNGQGGLFLFTAIFTTGVTGNTQLAGAGGTVNGLFFGCNGTVFSINRLSNGVNNWVVQNNWNVDSLNGTGPSGITLDITRGNVYKIQYQWLGFGNIEFFIQNPKTAQFVKVHQIQYSNSATVTSVLQPSMPLYFSSVNTTNTSNINLQTSSISSYCQGLVNDLGNLFSFNNFKALNNQTETCIFNLQNNSTFVGGVNFKTVGLLNVSLGNTANNDRTIFRFWLNATIGGTPVYTNLNSNQSCVATDTAGTTVSGGTLLTTFYLPQATSSDQIDITFLNINLLPGDILSITAQLNQNNATNSFVSLSWSEKY